MDEAARHEGDAHRSDFGVHGSGLWAVVQTPLDPRQRSHMPHSFAAWAALPPRGTARALAYASTSPITTCTRNVTGRHSTMGILRPRRF